MANKKLIATPTCTFRVYDGTGIFEGVHTVTMNANYPYQIRQINFIEIKYGHQQIQSGIGVYVPRDSG